MDGDDNAGLGTEVDLEWCTQQVSKRVNMKLRGFQGLEAHHKHEMRIMNRVLTWRLSEAGRAEMICTKEVQDTWTSCCVTMVWSAVRAGGRQYLGTSPLSFARAYLPADQARSLKSRGMRNLLIALSRQHVQFGSK